MSPQQRKETILRRIERVGEVRSLDLAKDLQVTPETIRKDLELLASENRIIRTHGGATRATDVHHDLPLPARQWVNREEKIIVAREAAKLVQPNDIIFLDASSTVLLIAEYLPEMPLTVLTNAHHVVVALGGRSQCDLICTGGNYEARSRSYVGAMAEDALKRFAIKWLFLGVDGLHPQFGASEVNPGQAVLKERLLPRAERVCIVCDSTKLGRKSPFIFAQTNQFDTLVTDDQASEEDLQHYRNAGIRTEIARIEK
ncbi:DeoR/GlpR family DNA-binding transcription regulator [Cerasicoccus maritimus]|uniref:DeoR/GlpR family DNA-binding transcription regulator n=1 Tax=Cerasicoccus maritimus TaxID=490089 RepID=UPI002852D70B|nr:DeoR/GlpR family DNA-binding transcription regulator [Cerasicoccus maritimus]